MALDANCIPQQQQQQPSIASDIRIQLLSSQKPIQADSTEFKLEFDGCARTQDWTVPEPRQAV